MTRGTRSALVMTAGIMSAGLTFGASAVSGQQAECLGEPATIVASGGGTITGTDGNDVILGTEQADVIEGRAGDDRICGLGGNDSLVGGDGFDRVNGGPDEDICEAEREVNCERLTGGSSPPASTTSTTAAPTPA